MTKDEALKSAIDHIRHMAAWITKQTAGYSFESLGEDMPSIEEAFRRPDLRDATPLKKTYIKPLRMIVEIDARYSDRIRDLLNVPIARPAASGDLRERIALNCADEFISLCETAARVAKRTGNTFVLDRQRVAAMIAGHFASLPGRDEEACKHENKTGTGNVSGDGSGSYEWRCVKCGHTEKQEWKARSLKTERGS